MNKKIITIIITILAVPMLLFAILFIRLASKLEIDEKARMSAPGNFIELSNGIVHYELKGDDESPVIVLIHGATIPYVSWDMNYKTLLDSGYRALRYDLFGRGYSDRPRIEYTKEMYVNQLYELLDRLNITDPVHIVGTSMGGAVAVFFASARPDMVSSLILIDPIGPYSMYSNNTNVIKKVAKSFKDRIFEKNTLTRRVRQIAPLRKEMKEQMKYKGVGWSIYSSVRNRDFDKLLSAYTFVGEKKLPTLLIWGEDDSVIPLQYSKEIKKLIPGITLHVVKGAGHLPHYEKPKIVNSLLIDFYNQIH